MLVFYFTGTGNSLHIARKFANAELHSIPQVLRGVRREFEAEKIGLVFPVYALAAPQSVRDFVRTVTLKCGYVFAILTYGNYAGNCCGWFEAFAARHGLGLAYANHILMADNYLPWFDAKEQMQKNAPAEKNAAALLTDVAASRRFINRGGITGRLSTGVAQLFWSKILGACGKFKVLETCTACGTCAKVCPTGNVALKDNRPVFADHCESCFACIQLCPAKAIVLPREKNRNERYRHPGVGIADIIQANDMG